MRFVGPLALLAALSSSVLQAGLCLPKVWTLDEITDAPVLAVGRVLSRESSSGFRFFLPDHKDGARAETMTATVEILRFTRPAGTGEDPPRIAKIRFVGRDGPDFSFCPAGQPDLKPGQVLLLPLAAHLPTDSGPWRLIGENGFGITMRVAYNMAEPALASADTNSFLVHELANAFRSRDAVARFTAASLAITEHRYLHPELGVELQRSIPEGSIEWAKVLGSLLAAFPNPSAEIQTWPPLRGFPLRDLAVSRLPAAKSEAMVWQSLLEDLPGLADEPYHPVFAYNSNEALSATITYLLRYRNDAAFLTSVRMALDKDSPGSSALAARLVEGGQRDCLPEALRRALKVIRRPEAEASDVTSSIELLLRYGADDQKREYTSATQQVKGMNPDFATFLERQQVTRSRFSSQNSTDR